MDKKIKVIYLIGALGKGGSEKQLYLMLKHMNLEKFSPQVIVFNSSDTPIYEQKIKDLGIKIIGIPVQKKGVIKRSIFLFMVFREFRPLIVHSWTVHDNPYAGLIGYLSCVPVRLGSLRSSPNYSGFMQLPKPIQYLCLHTTQAIVVNAQSSALELEADNFPKSKIHYLRNCIEVSNYKKPLARPINQVVNVPKESKIIGTVGNLRQNKNHHIFIDVLENLIKMDSSIYGVIIGKTIPGEEEYVNQLKKKVKELNIERNIIFAGFQDDVISILQKFDIFCLFSGSEGMPNVVLEAMAAKCPVVVTDVGDISITINHGINGFVINSYCVKEIASLLDLLLKNPNDLKQIGARGYGFVKKYFSCEQSAENLQAFYLRGDVEKIGLQLRSCRTEAAIYPDF